MTMSGAVAESHFVEIYRDHEPAIRRYCRRRLSPDDVDDAVLEVFAIAWRRSSDQPVSTDEIVPWLYGVARNVVRNQTRTSIRLRRLKARVSSIVGDSSTSPESVILRRSEDQMVLDALSSLRPNDQEILRLRTWEDLGRRDIAEVLGISPEAVDMRVNRALRRMEKALLERGHRFEDQMDSERHGRSR